MKRLMSVVFCFAVSAGLLYLVCRKVDMLSFLQIVKSAKPVYIFAIFFGVLASILVRGARWKYIALPFAAAESFTMAKIQAGGLAVNNLLPFRAGEFFKVFASARVLGVPVSLALGIVIVERALDLFVLSFIFFVFSPLFFPEYALIALAVFVVISMGLVFLVFIEKAIRCRKIENSVSKISALAGIIKNLCAGGAVLRQGKILKITLLSFAVWTIEAFIYFSAGKAVLAGNFLSFPKSALVVCAGALSSAVPSMPGYFGAFEAGLNVILARFGLGAEQALAYSAVLHLSMYFSATLLGIIALSAMSFSLGSVWKKISRRG